MCVRAVMSGAQRAGHTAQPMHEPLLRKDERWAGGAETVLPGHCAREGSKGRII